MYRWQVHGNPRFQGQQDTVYLAAFFDSPEAGRSWITLRMALFFEFLAQEWILVGALISALIMLWVHEGRKSGQSLSPQQAINMVNAEDGLFVDLRDSGEYNKGHIVDSLNIPATKLEGRMAELDKYRDKPLVLVCKMGQHSGAAGKRLTAEGYQKVYRMSGGMMEWGAMQLPLVK